MKMSIFFRKNLEQALWRDALRRNTQQGFADYLSKYPEGRYNEIARKFLTDFQQDEPIQHSKNDDLIVVENNKSISGYFTFAVIIIIPICVSVFILFLYHIYYPNLQSITKSDYWLIAVGILFLHIFIFSLSIEYWKLKLGLTWPFYAVSFINVIIGLVLLKNVSKEKLVVDSFHFHLTMFCSFAMVWVVLFFVIFIKQIYEKFLNVYKTDEGKIYIKLIIMFIPSMIINGIVGGILGFVYRNNLFIPDRNFYMFSEPKTYMESIGGSFVSLLIMIAFIVVIIVIFLFIHTFVFGYFFNLVKKIIEKLYKRSSNYEKQIFEIGEYSIIFGFVSLVLLWSLPLVLHLLQLIISGLIIYMHI